MATTEILQLGNPGLRQKSALVLEPDGPRVRSLSADLQDTLSQAAGSSVS